MAGRFGWFFVSHLLLIGLWQVAEGQSGGYSAPALVTAEWAADALKLVGAAGQVSLSGSTHLAAGPWPGLPGSGRLLESSLSSGGVACQEYERARVWQSLRLHGEDAELTVILKNTSQVVLRAFRLGDWSVQVAGPVRFEYRPSPADDYLARQGVAELWPSWWYRISSSWWISDRAGFAASTQGFGLVRRLWRWQAAAENQKLTFFICDDVPPGEYRRWTLHFRLSRNPDWRQVLAPYRDDLLRQFGRQQYQSDHRPVIQGLRPAPERITPGNPYGWVSANGNPDPLHDLTSVVGFRHWLDRLIRGCAVHDAQGVIAWGWACLPGKDEPWYPYDSLDLPPEVGRPVAEIRSALKIAGRRCGHLLRPGYDYERDEKGRLRWAKIIRFSPLMVNRVWPRLERADGLAYLDDFGIGFGDGRERSAVDDLRLLAALRQRAGPMANWFIEFPSDVSLCWAGGYEQLQRTPDGELQFYWLNNHQFEVLRWLHPESAWIIAQRHRIEPTAGLTELLEECRRRRVCPLIQDWLLP